MNHDISHCGNNKCPKKDTCYRYLAHLDAAKHSLGYLTYFAISEVPSDGSCTAYWETEVLTEDEVFNKCANKTVEEIESISNFYLQGQAIRYYLSRKLANYSDENPLEVSIKIEPEDEYGVSSLQIPTITKLSQTEKEGLINVYIEDWKWVDIDFFDRKEQLQIIKALEK